MGLSILARLGMDSSEFKSGLSDAQASTSSFTNKLSSAFMSATKMAGSALGNFAIGGVKDMIEFQKGMSEVFTLMPGISKSAMGSMEKDVRNLATTMGLDLTDAVSSLYQAISAGVDPGNAVDFLKTSAKTAIGGVSSLEDSVGALTTVINGYGMSAKDATRVSDVLFSVVKNGVTTMTELGQNIGKVTPIASSLGVSIEEVGAMFTVLTKQMGSGKTAEAGTAIRSMLAELAKEGKRANDNFRELGQGGFKDFIKNGGQVGDALMMMKENAEASGKSLMDMFEGVEAGNGALMLVTQGGRELSKQLQNVRSDAGATEEAFGTMEKTVSRQFDKLLSNLAELGLKIGEAFLPVINDLIPKLSAGMKDFAPMVADIARQIADISTKIIELAPAILKIVTALGLYTIGAKASAVATNILGTSVKSAAGPLLALFAGFELGKALGNGLAHIIKDISGALDEEFRTEQLAKVNDEIEGIAENMMDLDDKIQALKKSLGLIKSGNPLEGLKDLSFKDQVNELEQMVGKMKQLQDANKMGVKLKQEELEALQKQYTEMHKSGATQLDLLGLAKRMIKVREDIKENELNILRAMKKEKEFQAQLVEADEKRRQEAEKRIDAEVKADAERNKAYAMSLTFEQDIAKAVEGTRKQMALSRTEAGKIVILGNQIRDLELAKKKLIDDARNARGLETQEAIRLRDIEADIVRKRQDVVDIVKNKLKQARQDELQAVKDIVDELDKKLALERKNANEAKNAAKAKEDEVKALRENLKDAQGDLENFKKFFNTDIRGKLKVDVGELRTEFKKLKEQDMLPDGVKTLKDFEMLTRKNASEAKKKRDQVLADGKDALADAERLRQEEKDANDEAKRIEDEIAEKKKEAIKLENELEDKKLKTLEQYTEERKELERVLADLQKVNILPEFDASIVEAIETQAKNLEQLDHNVSALAGKNGSIKIDMDLDDSDITKESTQIEIKKTLQGFFVNQ